MKFQAVVEKTVSDFREYFLPHLVYVSNANDYMNETFCKLKQNWFEIPRPSIQIDIRHNVLDIVTGSPLPLALRSDNVVVLSNVVNVTWYTSDKTRQIK